MKEPTDTELNIAICEWRGWRDMQDGCGQPPYHANEQGEPVRIPNHITGIEALGHMHEAEKKLDAGQAAQYIIELSQIACELPRYYYPHSVPDHFKLKHSTARQCAIALVRVINPELFL